MYRPQFPYKTPPGFTDTDFSYSFDGNTNTTLLAGNIAGGVTIQNITMALQPDEMFLWRGWKIQNYSITFQPIYIQLRDPSGNYLSNALIPSGHWYFPSGTAGFGFTTIAIEPEVVCPAGSNIVMYIQNPSGVSVALPRVVFYGVKRGPEVQA